MNTIKMDMLGIKLDCLTYDEFFDQCDQWLRDKSSRSHCLALVNVQCCVSALYDRKMRDIYNAADVVGIDGMPFLRWARLFYRRESERFYAPDLLLQAGKRCKEKGYTFFLYGGYPGSCDKIEEYLAARYEGINVVGKYSPPFRPLTDEEDQQVCDMINEAQPDFLWIGLGSPKQDRWIMAHRQKIRRAIIVPSGATFDFFAGRIRQAPTFVRDSGFEWLFRLAMDFRRLWKRYTLYNVIFIGAFVLQRLGLLRISIDVEQRAEERLKDV